jgi:leucyl-tRNA synthetase
MKQIDFKEIEKTVRQIWDKVKIYKTNLYVSKDKKKYILDMFPYPS